MTADSVRGRGKTLFLQCRRRFSVLLLLVAVAPPPAPRVSEKLAASVFGVEVHITGT